MSDFGNGGPLGSAILDEELMTAKIGTVTSLISPDNKQVAICLLLGTRVKVAGVIPPSVVETFSLSIGDEATFSLDGFAFDCHMKGVVVSLEDLGTDLHFQVVSIPGVTSAESEQMLETA